MRFRPILYGLSIAAVAPCITQAAPTAEAFAKTWQLDFSFYDPQRLSIRLPGDGHETTFWYVLYQVTNHTGRDIQFYPSFRLVTDTLKELEGGADVSPAVFDVIYARHKKEFPFLAPAAKVTGLLLQGEENARSTVAVFRQFDPQASSFTIFVSGLSGDVTRLPSPSFNPKEAESAANARSFLLRRTLAIRYDVPGDGRTSTMATPVRRGREWVMQ